MQLSNFQNNNLGRQVSPRNQLVGKVVLLIGNDTAVLKKLTLQLAHKGADIALFCRQMSVETRQTIKTRVEALGRRLLLLTEKELLAKQETTNLATPLIQKITDVLGRLDIFIDLSATKKNLLLSPKAAPAAESIQPSWQVRQAIFAELAENS